jgi:chemotaxis protein CheD
MRKPPGLRGGWADTRPADAELLSPPVAPWPPVKPHAGWQHTRPADDFQPTRPLDDFQPTRPADDRPLPRVPHLARVPTPASPRPFGINRPADLPAAAPARVAVPPAAAPPMRRTVVAPSAPPANAQGHWQVADQRGQNLVLMPGQMHFGQQASSVRTLLGSCVAITLWHPVRRIGGMCHFLLPSRQRRPGDATDGRYGDEAVEAMVQALKVLRASPEEFVAHLYGGADTMSGVSVAKFNIGERNIEQGWSLIDRYGFQLDGVDVGEDIPRMVSLSLADGTVNMRRGTGSAPDHLRA